MTETRLPCFGDIEQAAARIHGAIMDTPCVASRTLSEICGCDLFLKFENLQFTASFKERGALNRLLTLRPDERAAGVVAMSAGNHAQALAYHARRLGIGATIVMPKGTPATKVSRTRMQGATVLVEGRNLSEAQEVAQRQSALFGLTLVHPFDDPEIIAGQGTLGLEMLAAVPDAEMLVVPVGGGGLIAGIATAAKAINPKIEIIGVQSQTYPSMIAALRGDEQPSPDGLTIAEGIAVKTAGLLTRRIVRLQVDRLLTVSEEAIERAVALLQSVEKTVVEGAGAAGLAAILEYEPLFVGRRVVTPLTGGNIDGRRLASVIMRDLVRTGRLVRISVAISDQPGEMAALAAIFGDEGANIVEVDHDRLRLALNARGAVLDVVAEVEDRDHGQRLIARLVAEGMDVQ